MKVKWFLLILGLVFIGTTASAADGDMIVNGKIGVGTASPASKLDVNGDVRVGNSSAACTSSIEGAVRYNAASKAMEFCNGTIWMALTFDASTKLLLHLDGTSGSTAITDSSSSSHVMTGYGTAQISTSSPKFGTGSLSLDGSGYVTTPYSDDFNFGGGDFTIDFWIKRSDQATRYVLTNTNSAGYSGFCIQFISNDIQFSHWTPSTYNFLFSTSGITMNTGQWYHLAFVRSSSNISIYLDGTSVASTSISGALADASNELKIGRRYDGQASANFYGYLDEIRITKGKAVWTSNFTPPTAPY